jgi:hypothetical protein
MRQTLALFSFIMVMVAAWFIFAGFSIETTVSAPAGLETLQGTQGVANLQLMHLQLLDVIIGVVSGLAACVLFAGSAIVGAIENAVGLNP